MECDHSRSHKVFRVASQPLGGTASHPESPVTPRPSAAQHVIRFGPSSDLVQCHNVNRWRPHVGLAVKLDVLMMITVVAFVSAIVLGAF
jgi:hypothetical protein